MIVKDYLINNGFNHDITYALSVHPQNLQKSTLSHFQALKGQCVSMENMQSQIILQPVKSLLSIVLRELVNL